MTSIEKKVIQIDIIRDLLDFIDMLIFVYTFCYAKVVF